MSARTEERQRDYAPVEDRDRRGDHVREQGATGRAGEPNEVVLEGVLGEVVGAAEQTDEEVLGRHVCWGGGGVSERFLKALPDLL